MKKIAAGIFFLFLSFIQPAHAGGGITHMFLAQETIDLLPDAQLRNLLKDNLEAYLVGAYYPDSGYVKANSYGEDSHWNPFIYTFADYIKEKYPDPASQNPKLIAFLMGCAAHSKSDIIMHWTFYNVSKDKDFHGDWNEAHQYGDVGIDLLINIDKNQWLTHPASWWVPIRDLLEVYHRMGNNQYTEKEIIEGNTAIFFAGYGERLISAEAYPYLRWYKMPWTATNYYDWPVGGIKMDEQQVANYQMEVWHYLTGKIRQARPVSAPHASYDTDIAHSPALNFARNAANSGAISLTVAKNPDGSVELTSPVVRQPEKFRGLLGGLMVK